MGFGYIIAGLFFLFNPNINVFDFLPDFIGYLLIYRGLFQMSFASVKMQDVRAMIAKLILITGAHFLSLLLLPYADGDTFYLVLVFVFAVLETMYLIPAVTGLFDGFYELGRRFNVESVFDSRKSTPKKGNNEGKTVLVEGAEQLKVFTIVFFLIKNIGYVLPELTSLQMSEDYSSKSRLHVALSDFKPLIYGFCFIVVLVFGCVWLIRFLRYVKRMKRDTVLTERIREHFDENVASNPGLMAALRMKKVRLLFILAAAGSFMFIMEGVDIIPNALASVFLIIAFVIMLKYDRLAWGGIAVSAAAGLISIANLFIQIPYYEEYEAMAARHIATAAEIYRTVRFCGTVEYIVVLAMFVIAFVVFSRVMKQHAAHIGITGNVTQYSADERRKELLKAVYARIFGACVGGVIYFVLGAAYFTLSMYFAEIFLVNIVVSLIWIALVWQAMSSAYENIYERLEMNY